MSCQMLVWPSIDLFSVREKKHLVSVFSCFHTLRNLGGCSVGIMERDEYIRVSPSLVKGKT